MCPYSIGGDVRAIGCPWALPATLPRWPGCRHPQDVSIPRWRVSPSPGTPEEGRGQDGEVVNMVHYVHIRALLQAVACARTRNVHNMLHMGPWGAQEVVGDPPRVGTDPQILATDPPEEGPWVPTHDPHIGPLGPYRGHEHQ